jgi:hypothetical protein
VKEMASEAIRLTYYDKLVIGVIALVIVIGFIYFGIMPTPQNPVLEVEVLGKVKQTLDLTKQEGEKIVVMGRQGYSIIEVGKNKVRMVDSACEDKICVHTGWISKPGQQIVCIPNQVVLRFRNVRSDLDGING